MSYRHLSFAIHGPWGAGKSWFADTAPGPRLTLDAEGGVFDTLSEKVIWDPAYPLPENLTPETTVVVPIREWAPVGQVMQVLESGNHPFDTVIIDSFTEVQKVLKDTIRGGIENHWGMQQWGKLLDLADDAVRRLRNLTWPTSPKPINFVLITGTDRETLPAKPLLQGSLRKQLPGFFDIVGYIYVVPNGSGGQDRLLQVAPSDVAEAKCRPHAISLHYGGTIPNPDIKEILRVVNA